MLKVQNINTFYGEIQALTNVSIHVKEGEIVTLIGANGAGKTTLLHSIIGLVPPTKGEIIFKNQKITKLPPNKIITYGLSLVPEGRQVFGDLSVVDNLYLGAYQRYNKEKRAQIIDDINAMYEIFPRLKEREKQPSGKLSGGEQQMLAIARALMSKPSLLLLDEPSMGLAPIVVKEIFEKIKMLRNSGTTILLVEQNAQMALKIADRGYVIETGRIFIQGPSDELLTNEEVKRAYLGKTKDEKGRA